MARVLIVEDERHIADGLCFNLEAEGYQAQLAETGEAALDVIARNEVDLVVLDVMLPGIDGFEVVSRMRAGHCYVPVLMLTARNRPEDVLKGFQAGADDYLPKPFELPILIARISGLLRRSEWAHRARPASVVPDPPSNEQPADLFRFSGKEIDFNKLELRAGEKQVPLTVMEANLLRYLVQHSGKAVSRKAMLEEVWGVREDTDTRAIDNFIVRLRRYIEDEPTSPRHLVTVRGLGYRFLPEPDAKRL